MFHELHMARAAFQLKGIKQRAFYVGRKGLAMRNSYSKMKCQLLMAGISVIATACSTMPSDQYSAAATQPASGLMGPRGADGPAGPAGAQGSPGARGEAGAVLVGPAGAQGPAGPMGKQGDVGARGPAGAVAAGPAGVAGVAGPAGARGAAGAQGAQGSSEAGPRGPVGAAGAAGAQGARGETGSRGETLVGPSGPVGFSGQPGATGVKGEAGERGTTTAGAAGTTGMSGVAGTAGALGKSGTQGPVGIVSSWTAYRDVIFMFNQSDILASQKPTISEVAEYLSKNPSLKVGIDSSIDPSGSDPRDQTLSDRRTGSVREALIAAGVPAARIQTGVRGDSTLVRDRRIGLLVSTIN